jgi:hypothetical protein
MAEIEFPCGDHDAAERTLNFAEGGYDNVLSFMSDPKYTDNIDTEEERNLRTGRGRLRCTLNNVRPAK